MTVNTHSAQIQLWREQLKQHQTALAQRYLSQQLHAQAYFQQQAQFHDRFMREIWHFFMPGNSACLVAVGGYGRKELYPQSDIDILILHSTEQLSSLQQQQCNQQIEQLIGACWDIGLAIGQSVRSINECMLEAKKDISVMTNLLEARFLCGQRSLLQALNQRLANELDSSRFFNAKLDEQASRHKRCNDSAYNLEPNIKESPGGLRDLHMLLWQASGLRLGNSWRALQQQQLISRNEARQIARHQRRLQHLRIHLHLLTKRREDRLIFDCQNELAAQLGFHDNEHMRASEQLMHSFYQSAQFISLMNRILLRLMQPYTQVSKMKIKPINADFAQQQGQLVVLQDDLFQRRPAALFECFLLRQQHADIDAFSPQCLRLLYQARTLITASFRRQSHHQQLFLRILQQTVGVDVALKEMSQLGILGAYIPAFARITGQMQHDLFHVYTVDEHIMRVVANLHRFSLPEFAHEFPLCSQLFKQFDQPYLLYLAALFHDIAKGRGGDHSQLGEQDAARFCRAHALPRQDAALVAWLVKAHLMMSSTAQKSDLSDPSVIHQFAQQVSDRRRLIALYLLTVADIRGTSPKVWNSWKAKLLETLFLATERLLQGQQAHASTELTRRQREATEKLGYYGITPANFHQHWQLFGEHYFLRYDGNEIVWHTRLLLTHLHSPRPIVRARLSPNGDGIQVMIYQADRDNLFAQICQALEQLAFSILEARIVTTQHAYALDTFLIMEQEDKSINYRDLLSYIEYELTQRLEQNLAPQAVNSGRLSRQLKHMPIAPRVETERQFTDTGQASDKIALNIVAGDRPGLLSSVAYVLYQQRFKILNAKINTLGARAEDSFLIMPAHAPQETDEDRTVALKSALLGQLQQFN